MTGTLATELAAATLSASGAGLKSLCQTGARLSRKRWAVLSTCLQSLPNAISARRYMSASLSAQHVKRQPPPEPFPHLVPHSHPEFLRHETLHTQEQEHIPFAHFSRKRMP